MRVTSFSKRLSSSPASTYHLEEAINGREKVKGKISERERIKWRRKTKNRNQWRRKFVIVAL